MAFDPIAYKESVTEEWDRAAQGWHRWGRAINSWLDQATQVMLDQARITYGNRVIDIQIKNKQARASQLSRDSGAVWFRLG